MSENQDVPPAPGKPWNIDSFHATYEDANSRREELVGEWESVPIEGMQAKVRYHAHKGNYSVRMRLHPDFEPEKPKKSKKKTKKKKKRDNDE